MSRYLLNTLYVMTPGACAHLDGETVRIDVEGQKVFQMPLLHLEHLVFFGSTSLTTALMQRCAEDGRAITLLDSGGRFKCRLVGPTSGNILLRLAQYKMATSESGALATARPFVAGKIRNMRYNLLRAARETHNAECAHHLSQQADQLISLLQTLPHVTTLDAVRGIEGQATSLYFEMFGDMILREKSEFAFSVRTRRPPKDRVNALLSFLYTLLTSECVAALEGVGLDPQLGFLHSVRPGRPALALDLMEEFRPYLADRFALRLINKRTVDPSHFEEREGGSVFLNEKGRRAVLAAYQARKQEEVSHSLLKSKVPVGLLTHLQARLLARYLREDSQAYVPFIAK
jgi:CRISPR-associated protein Cas1